MFRVHTSIIRSIRCWVAAYGFLHRVFGWVVVLSAAAWVMCTVRMVHGTIRTVHMTHATQLNILGSWWWAYVPETCRAKNTSIELPICIKLAFHIILWTKSVFALYVHLVVVLRSTANKRTKRRIRKRNKLILFTRVWMLCSFRAVSFGTTHIYVSTYTDGSTVFPNCATYS